MKKLIALVIILLIVAAVFIIYEIKSATAMPDIETPQVILEIDEGVVELWPAQGETWQKAKDGQILETGDKVRTLDNSRASIIFYDTSVTRLDENTEILIDAVSIESENYLKQDVEVELLAGRVWSRILNLLDLDSKFEVKTSTVVATVRGTSFSMAVDERGQTELDVIDNLVDVTLYSISSATQEIIKDKPRKLKLEAGNYINIGPFKKLEQGEELPDIFALKIKDITSDKLGQGWFSQNISDDEEFFKRIQGLRRDQLRKYMRRLPDSFLFSLQRFGERLGSMIIRDNEKKEKLEKFYMARRLAEVAELAHQTKIGIATQELVQFENLLKADGEGKTTMFKNILPNILFLYQGFWSDIIPSSKSYRLKQRIEELAFLGVVTEEQELYWKLMNLEERIREAERLIRYQELDLVSNVLDVARLGLENLKEEVNVLSESEKKQIILDKINYDLKSINIIQDQIQTQLIEPEEGEELKLEEITDEEPVATPEEPASAPAEEPPVQEEKTLESLSVSALPNPVYVNSSSDLSAQARYTDSSTEDVTTKVDWEVFGDIGTISNGIFSAGVSAGSAQIQATYTLGGVTKVASLTMTVKAQPAILENIRLMATKIVLDYGDTSTLTVEASYSDGKTKDVTSSSSFSHSNQNAGEIRGNTFYSYPAQGQTTITATYTENGVTKQDVIVLTVQGELL